METSSALYELACVSLACRDQDTLLKTFAARVASTLGARSVLIWQQGAEDEGLSCRMRWSEPGERLNPATEPAEESLLAEVYETFSESPGTRRIGTREIEPDALLHLEEASRTRVKSILYATLPGTQGTVGVVEVLNKRTGEFTAEDAQFLAEASGLAGQALTNLGAIEEERQSQLATLDRLTALYDLGRTFTSTLELAELLPIVAGKIRDILGAAACNLWLADAAAEDLYLAQQVGEDPSAEDGARAPSNEGLFGEVIQQANPKLIEDATSDPALEERRKTGGEFVIQSWMAAPLRKEDDVLGVVELVNKADGTPFDEDDLFFLSSISEQAAVALHNANLLESERKVHALDALLKISQEITSTLDLDHVLTTVVHQAGTVIPFDRCVIGFFDRGRFVLGAVSGETEVPKTREMSELRERLEWVAQQENPVSADLFEDGWHAEPEGARAQFGSFLEAHEHNGFYALPAARRSRHARRDGAAERRRRFSFGHESRNRRDPREPNHSSHPQRAALPASTARESVAAAGREKTEDDERRAAREMARVCRTCGPCGDCPRHHSLADAAGHGCNRGASRTPHGERDRRWSGPACFRA